MLCSAASERHPSQLNKQREKKKGTHAWYVGHRREPDPGSTRLRLTSEGGVSNTNPWIDMGPCLCSAQSMRCPARYGLNLLVSDRHIVPFRSAAEPTNCRTPRLINKQRRTFLLLYPETVVLAMERHILLISKQPVAAPPQRHT